jgi:serine/threonine-protein kinase
VYLVMPHVEGENLRARLMRGGPMPVEAAVAIGRDVAAAIDHAHRLRVLHRDIKPENILLHAERALVCDFGLARALDAAALEPLSSSGLIVGTPAYMSPEQAMGGVTDAGSDIYALGCVMYEMLTGELPFTGATRQALLARQMGDDPRPIRTMRQDLPEALEHLVMQALAREPEKRPATASRLLEGL